MDKFKELLSQECIYRLSEQLIDELLAPASVVELKRNQILAMSGTVNTFIYIVKEGVIRYSYMDGMREMTHAFALPASVIIPVQCYYAQLPAFYQLDACCKSTVLKIPQSHYRHLVDTSPEFARWAFHYVLAQLFYLEKKDFVVNGNARERFISLLHRRPEVIEKVALRHIASYLGITQPYLSRLKSELKVQKKVRDLF